MKFSGLANLDIYWLVKELKELEGGWFQKIWKTENGYKLRIHKEKNYDLILSPPRAIYLTKYSYTGKEPDNFVMKVRKELDKSKLVEVYQPNFDRVVAFRFDNGKILIIELFSKGNIILVSNGGKTLVATRYESWKDREIRPNRPYKFPSSSGLDPTKMTPDEFKNIFTEKDIIRSLIKGVKLGNRYLEEACLVSGEDKSARKPKNIEKLFNIIKDMLSHYSPGIQGIPVCFKLKTLDEKFTPAKSVNDAIDEIMLKELPQEKPKPSQDKLKKLQIRLEEQERALKKFEEDAKKYKEIGDLIYQNFNRVDEILREIREMRSKGKDWREIERELGVKIIEKEGKVIVDL